MIKIEPGNEVNNLINAVKQHKIPITNLKVLFVKKSGTFFNESCDFSV
jgi:hypothetical protein